MNRESPPPLTGGNALLAAFVVLARLAGKPVTPQRVLHDAGVGIDDLDLVRLTQVAGEIGLRARHRSIAAASVAALPAPLMIRVAGGGAAVILRREGTGDDLRWLVLPAGAQVPHIWSAAEFDAHYGGELLLLAARDAEIGDGSRFDLAAFFPLVVKYRRAIRDVLIASFVVQLLALATPLLFQVVIDKVLVHQTIATLDVIVIALVAVALWDTVLGGLRTWLLGHTSNRIDVELSARVFGHMMAVPLGYFESRRAGDTVARIREIENLRQFMTSGALTLLLDSVFSVVFLIVMAFYSITLTLIVIGSLVIFVAISLAVTPRLRALLDEKVARGAENQALLVEAVTSMSTIKSFAAEPQFRRAWEDQIARYVRVSFKTLNLGNLSNQSIQGVSKLTTAATLYFGALAVISGTLTVGGLVAFNMLASRLSQPVLRLAQLWTEFQQVQVAVSRLADLLETRPEPRGQSASINAGARSGAVTFEGVHFRYRPDLPEALRGVDLAIEPGEIVGVVGPSGSGKSTIARLIQRLYVPERGRIAIDGTEVGLLDSGMLRRMVGIVPQEPVLFNRSIAQNIAFADPTRPIEQIVAAARLAGADAFIRELPHGYDTMVGERGGTLSGGQRQRIAIARALIGDPRILIFDEATSALDVETEAAVQRNLASIAARRTLIVIAHRLSAVRICDRILTVEDGRVTESGTHDVLLAAGGTYARLHAAQGALG